MTLVFIRNSTTVTPGSDVTPTAVNWANISESTTGTGSNATQTIAAIDAPITLRASWTSSGSTPTIYVYRNGALLTSSSTSPIDFSVTVGQTVNFAVSVPSSGSASGTVTVTNQSDAAATLDTFTYSVTSVVTNDKTPNPLNWVQNDSGNGYAQTNALQILGIDVPITLRLDWSVTSGNYLPVMNIYVNGVSAVSGSLPTIEVAVNPGDYVGIYYTIFYDYLTGVFASGPAAVYNMTDGGTLLDTFDFSVSYSYAGEGGGYLSVWTP